MGRRATGSNYEACYEVLCGGSHITGRQLVHEPGQRIYVFCRCTKVNVEKLPCSVALCHTGGMTVFPGLKVSRREGFSFGTAMERKKKNRSDLSCEVIKAQNY